jgi:hypothetical protein
LPPKLRRLRLRSHDGTPANIGVSDSPRPARSTAWN